MKRLVLLAAIIVGMTSLAMAAEWRTFRSTEIKGAATEIFVASGSIILKDIVVTSGTPAATFRYFTSTTATGVTLDGVLFSSSSIYDVETTGDIFPLDEPLRNGFWYTTTGDAQVRVRWNWEDHIVNR